MGFLNEMAIKSKIGKLQRCQTDLCDDYNAITNYNRKIDGIISDFQLFVRTGNGGVVNKLYDYKEPLQSNDSNLNSARTYIQYEINRLQRELSNGESGAGGGGR